MAKTGIFGGTFNPPHLGHKKLAISAAEQLGLDRVLIMPASIPPHKQPVQLASAGDRAEMCRLTFCDDPRFEVSTLEIERGSKSYTVDTLDALRQIYPDDEFYLVTGSDMLDGFKKWYRWQDILKKAFVCTAIREKNAKLDYSGYTEEEKAKFIPLTLEPTVISSTEIREMLGRGEYGETLLAPGVIDFIKANGLYADRFPEYRKKVEELLDPDRLAHSYGVSRAARKLALHYGADADKAELAGLLHDIMKNAPKEEQKAVIELGGHKFTDVELANSKVWHAMAGEAYLRLELGITDKEILSAVRYHTTGRAGMSLLDKIVYIGDFISEERDYPDVGTVRKYACESLEKAILYTSAYTVRTLAAAEKPIHPDTLDCYNDILLNLGKDEK